MPTDIIPVELYPHQELPLKYRLDPSIKHIAQIGTRGSAKTRGMNRAIWSDAHTFQGNDIGCWRAKLDDAIGEFARRFLEECPAELILKTSGSGSTGITFWIQPQDWDGRQQTLSRVHFGGVISGGKQDPDKCKGEFGMVCFDEGDQIEEAVWNQADLSCRKPGTRQTRMLCSNRPRNFHWIRERWDIDNDNAWWFNDPLKARRGSYVCIRSKTSDNRSLGEAYIENLRKSLPESFQRIFIDGLPGFLEDGVGVYTKQWDFGRHILDFEIGDLPIMRAFDYGRRAAIVWSQSHPFGDGTYQWRVIDHLQGWDVGYTDFMVMAMEHQRARFGSRADYLNCDDPTGENIEAIADKNSRDVLKEFGITNIHSTRDRLLNNPIYRAEHVRKWLGPHGDEPYMVVHPRCNIIIDGFAGGYQYPKDRSTGQEVSKPRKDGYFDHGQDGLQYTGTNFLPKVGEPLKIATGQKSINERSTVVVGVGFTANEAGLHAVRRGVPQRSTVFVGSGARNG